MDPFEENMCSAGNANTWLLRKLVFLQLVCIYLRIQLLYTLIHKYLLFRKKTKTLDPRFHFREEATFNIYLNNSATYPFIDLMGETTSCDKI